MSNQILYVTCLRGPYYSIDSKTDDTMMRKVGKQGSKSLTGSNPADRLFFYYSVENESGALALSIVGQIEDVSVCSL